MQQPTQAELARIVHVTACATATWDSKEYDLNKGTDIAIGVVEHWKTIHPNVAFEVTEIAVTPIEAREIVDILGEENRGQAFAGLKKRGRPAKDGD